LISASVRAHTCPLSETGDRRHEPRFAASPLTPQPDRPVRIIPMAVPDHASPVAPRNHSLARTTVVNSSQTRTRATMLALTSHYLATNAKHPRHAPGSPARWAGWPGRQHGPAGPRGASSSRHPSPHCHHQPRQSLNHSRSRGLSRHDAPSCRDGLGGESPEAGLGGGPRGGT
jgi:hypothetical protein